MPLRSPSLSHFAGMSTAHRDEQQAGLPMDDNSCETGETAAVAIERGRCLRHARAFMQDEMPLQTTPIENGRLHHAILRRKTHLSQYKDIGIQGLKRCRQSKIDGWSHSWSILAFNGSVLPCVTCMRTGRKLQRPHLMSMLPTYWLYMLLISHC